MDELIKFLKEASAAQIKKYKEELDRQGGYEPLVELLQTKIDKLNSGSFHPL